jgi:hypothetical protein
MPSLQRSSCDDSPVKRRAQTIVSSYLPCNMFMADRKLRRKPTSSDANATTLTFAEPRGSGSMFTVVAPRRSGCPCSAPDPPVAYETLLMIAALRSIACSIDLRSKFKFRNTDRKDLIQIKVSSPCRRCKCTSDFQRLWAGA